MLTDGKADQTNRNPDLFSLLHGLHWLCANLAVTQPLLLAVDDVQWSDENSLRFLTYLGGRVEDLPVLVVATLRTGEPDSPRGAAQGTAASAGVDVYPAGEPDARRDGRRRAREVSDEAPPAFCAACHENHRRKPTAAGGAGSGAEVERVAPVKASATRVLEIGAKSVPDRLLARISQLSPEALEVARADGDARAAGDVEAHRGAGVASAATTRPQQRTPWWTQGVLTDTNRLGFVHPLLRSAVEGAMTIPRRDRLAVRAAEVHRDDGSPPQVVASHLLNIHGGAAELGRRNAYSSRR